MKWIAGAAVAASLMLVDVASHATPADSSAAPPAPTPPAAADSALSPPPRPAKSKPALHPKKPLGRSAPGRSAAHDTLSATELKGLKLPPAPAPPKGRPPRVRAVALEVRHRVFGDFRERAIVGMKQDFRIGDTDYAARLVDFVPDWAMGLQSFRVYSRTNEPNNPAFRIVVRENGQVRDTVWAFMHMPPHFARNSMLSFKVARIEFADHAPVPNTAPDSTGARAAGRPDTTAARRSKP